MTPRPDPVWKNSIYSAWDGAKPMWEWSAAKRSERGTSHPRSSSRISSDSQKRRGESALGRKRTRFFTEDGDDRREEIEVPKGR